MKRGGPGKGGVRTPPPGNAYGYIHLDNVDHVNLFVSNRIQTLGLYFLNCKFRNGSTMIMAIMGRLFRLEANKTDHKNVTLIIYKQNKHNRNEETRLSMNCSNTPMMQIRTGDMLQLGTTNLV